MKTNYRVIDYETDDILDGSPSEALIAASFADGNDTGAVAAIQDEDGMWCLAPQGDWATSVYVEKR